jgi:hypothetical protein
MALVKRIPNPTGGGVCDKFLRPSLEERGEETVGLNDSSWGRIVVPLVLLLNV